MKASHKLCLPGLSILFLSFWLALANVAQGQAPPQDTNNTVDSGSRSGMRVDPSTLALGFQLSLGNYPGRAGSSLPSNISYSSKVWRIEFEDIFPSGTIQRSRTFPRYAEHSAAGWTTNFDPPTLEGLELQPYDDAGVGICMSPSCPQPDPNEAIFYVYRLLAHMPDGSTHELRRDDTPTQDHITGNVYYAVDGSRIRYDESNQTLYLPDGSRYVYATNSVQYIDRNGNTLTYDPGTKQWSDTLGRTIGRPPLATGTTGYVTYNIPGVAGSTVNYRLRWRYLSEVLTNANPLRYKGDRTWTNPTMQTLSPSLFSSWPVPDEYVMTEVTALFNPVVLNEVELPNGRRYTFTYNVWGEIDKVVYPTGGYERYVYGPIDGISTSLQRSAYAQANRGVVDRWVSVTGDGTDEVQNHWHYSATGTNSPYTVTITAPDGSYTKRLLHGGENSDMRFGFDDVRNGMAYDESSYSSSGQMLRRTLTEWTKSGPLPGGEGTATRDPRVTKTVDIILDTGGNALTKTTSFAYDADLNRISTSEYNFVSVSQTTGQTGAIGSITAGTLLRTSEATYLVNDPAIAANTRNAYRARNLVGLPTSSRLKNAAGSIVAQSSISYDEVTYPPLTYGAVTGWNNPGTERGNATTTSSWLNSTGAYLQTHAQYDQSGNVRNVWDAKGNESQVEYSSAYSYAYPTLTRTAVPDPSGQYGSTTPLVSTSVYDFNTGLVSSQTDANNQITSYTYTDPLNRQRTVTPPDGGLTTYNYYDGPGSAYVETVTRQSSTQNIYSYQFFDRLGRPNRSFVGVGGGNYTTADTQYDPMGRVSRVSNPYLSTGSASAINPSGAWTTTAYDALGRVVSVTTPDGAQVGTAYAGSSSGTLALTVTVTDQELNKRRSLTDAQGRLIRVDEPDGNGNLGVVTSPLQPTSYTYDVLDNLTTVSQGVQTRYFMYDSLRRLMRARSPEQNTNASLNLSDPLTGNSQWSIAYQYDNNGNLTRKTDARGVYIDYVYDALNRNTNVNYSDATPDTLRQYDLALNGKGRMNQTWQAGSTTSATYIDSFDALGRPLVQRQRYQTAGVWSGSFQTTRAYNLAGAVTSQTYPSVRTVNYAYDSAGRTNSFTGNLGDGTTPPRTYSTGILYSPLGGITKEQFGTDTALYNKSFYNSRGQLAEIRVGTYHATDPTWWNRGAIINHYSDTCWGACGGSNSTTPMTDNNGNLKKQDVYIPGNDQLTSYTMWWQGYDYDELNRLERVREINSAGATLWQQEYVYDRYGNRTIHQTNTWGPTSGPLIPKPSFEVQPGTNRLYAPGDLALLETQRVMQYDPAGNLKKDKDSNGAAVTRAYDAENRMTSETQSTGTVSGSYSYNGDGQRVRRKVGGVETWAVYGIDGELVAEYAASGATASPQKEYGYRNGQLLITAEPAGAPQNVVWQNAVGVSVAGNSLTKTAATGWGNGGAASTQSIVSGDGYVEFTATETNKDRVCGLSNGDTNQSWTDLDFGLYMRADGKASIVEFGIYYSAINVPIATGDLLRVSIEGGVVKYKKNGTVFHTSGATATYPLKVDTAFYTTASTLSNVAISGDLGGGSTVNINWLVADQLGTPRMVFDKTGALATTKRHDYLPFGEELFAGTGLRTGGANGLGYSGDNLRQKFTSKERDNETGLDYFLARYYSSMQGRFTSVDPANAGAEPSNPQSWNGYAYAFNNPLKYQDPDGLKVRVCDTSGNCTDDKTDLTDEQWNKWFGGDKSIKLDKGKVYKDGELIGTYQQQSCDSCLYDIFSMGRQITASDPGGRAVKLWAGSVVAGVTGGTAYYFAAPFLAPTVTTLALRGAPLLPLVPSAIDKLQKLGISPERASAIVQSPASQKLIDNANNGNINHVQEVGGKLIRITTDPSGQRIISAGIMRANSITNGIANGRFTPKK